MEREKWWSKWAKCKLLVNLCKKYTEFLVLDLQLLYKLEIISEQKLLFKFCYRYLPGSKLVKMLFFSGFCDLRPLSKLH